MTAKDIETLFDYGYWANAKLFQAASRLTAEQFTRHVSGSYGSVRNTLVHMMSTEWGWLDRSGGLKRGPKLNASDFPTFTSVIEKWMQIETHVRSFLAGLREEDINRVVEFAIADGPKQTLSVGQIMQHAAVHGVHHRGQLALLLRTIGSPAGDFDLFFYYSRHQ